MYVVHVLKHGILFPIDLLLARGDPNRVKVGEQNSKSHDNNGNNKSLDTANHSTVLNSSRYSSGFGCGDSGHDRKHTYRNFRQAHNSHGCCADAFYNARRVFPNTLIGILVFEEVTFTGCRYVTLCRVGKAYYSLILKQRFVNAKIEVNGIHLLGKRCIKLVIRAKVLIG